MPQAAPPPTDVEIRQAIAETIRASLVSLYGAELGEAVRVHDHWLWGFSLGENASLLRVKSGPELGLIHGWIIGLSGVTRNRPEPNTNTPQGVYSLRKKNPNRRDILRTYRIWCYHQFDAGATGFGNTDNSESKLSAELEAVSNEFSKHPLMGIENEWLMGHEELQFNPIDVFKFGEAQANVAQGSLGVRLMQPLDLNQY